MWLEIHHTDLRTDSAATQASFDVGHQVGDIARQLNDPTEKGTLIGPHTEGFDAGFTRSQALLQSAPPIFEAGFRAEGEPAFADVMLSVKKGSKKVWRMVEVKSSTSVKDCHRDDVAVQAFIARSAGVPLAAIALAHIDSTWVYPGNGDYQGLMVEHDLTEDAFGRGETVRDWINEADLNWVRHMKASADYLGIAHMQERTAYEIWARNAHGDIWLPEAQGFLISRYKMRPKPFLLVEHHWTPANHLAPPSHCARSGSARYHCRLRRHTVTKGRIRSCVFGSMHWKNVTHHFPAGILSANVVRVL